MISVVAVIGNTEYDIADDQDLAMLIVDMARFDIRNVRIRLNDKVFRAVYLQPLDERQRVED